MTLESAATRAIRELKMLPRPGMTVVAGVSGGADSVALLLFLAGLEENAPRIVACHFNHMLRGDESVRDAEFVSRLCEKHGVELVTRAADTAAFSRENRLSPEQGARELRYAFFREVLGKVSEGTGAGRIATAHTMDDRAETVLMRVLRGSGGRGLSSIRPVSGDIIRPFFAVSRSQVLEYLRAKGEKWVEDSSNRSDIYTRNRVRNRLMPLLETFNPRVKEALNRLADTAAADYSHISLEAARAFGAVFPLFSGGALFGLTAAFARLHKAVRTEVLRSAYSKVRGGLERLEFGHLEEMDALLMSAASGAVNLPYGIRMEKSYGAFLLSGGAGADGCHLTGGYRLTVEREGAVELPWGMRAVFEKTSGVSLRGRRGAGHFSLEKARLPLEVRSFAPGDRTVPLGMKGSKKLKAVFADKKVPSFLRNRLPVFVCGGDIIWAGGVVVNELYKAERGKECLRITLGGGAADFYETVRRG